MRAREFLNAVLESKLVEESTGYYTVGDSHAVGLANYAGKPWQNKGKDGLSSTNSLHTAAINSIPKGSVVVISAGANDTFAAKADPQAIARSVSNLVNAATSKGLKVTYLLFPVGTKPNAEVRAKTREAIQQSLNVPIIDLEGSKLVDGVHANASAYINASKKALAGEKPTAAPIADKADGAASKESTELTAGPPFPPTDVPAVKALQTRLQELGYSVGSTGIDGKYGPRTVVAVAAFKKDNNISGDGQSMTADDMEKLKSAKKVDNPTPTGAAAPSGELGPLSQDSVTRGKVGEVLNFIARPESGGKYDAVYPGRSRPQILDMTLEQLFQDMRERGNASGSSASGRYQYIRKTLAGLAKSMGLDPKTTKFDPETQDKIVIYHLRANHGLDKWLSGRMSNEEFLDRLSKTWAGLPNPGKGGSFYAGVLDNKAGSNVKTALAGLDKIQNIA